MPIWICLPLCFHFSLVPKNAPTFFIPLILLVCLTLYQFYNKGFSIFIIPMFYSHRSVHLVWLFRYSFDLWIYVSHVWPKKKRIYVSHEFWSMYSQICKPRIYSDMYQSILNSYVRRHMHTRSVQINTLCLRTCM